MVVNPLAEAAEARRLRHFNDFLAGDPVPYNPNNHTAFPSIPARRDVFVLPPQGYFVIRFVADNPGVWLFHCHIDWHLAQGLAMVLIEAPLVLQETTTIPEQHYEVCRAAGVPFEGNAAAHDQDFLDLKGQNKQPAFLPGGFTARGIVALVFSVISALLGMAFIVVYGLSVPVVLQKDDTTNDENGANGNGMQAVADRYHD